MNGDIVNTIKENTMTKCIDMNKTYRYRNGELATILTTNRQNDFGWNVISMNEYGEVLFHKADGRESRDGDDPYGLVEVTPYEHFNMGDIVEVTTEYENASLYYWHSVDEFGNPLVQSKSPSGCLPIIGTIKYITLRCKAENVESPELNYK